MKFSKTKFIQGVTLLLIITFLINPLASAKMASVPLQKTQAPVSTPKSEIKYPGYYYDRPIAIVVDPSQPLLVETATKVFHSASMVYKNIQLVQVKNWYELQNIIESDYWIKAYFIDSRVEGISLDGIHSYEELAILFNQNTNSYHVIGSGSTNLLAPLLENKKVRVDGSDIIDSELSYFYNLWEIGDILAENKGYEEAAKDFKALGVEYFARNMNSLVNSQINPINPLGEENLAAKEAAFDQSLIEMQDIYQITPSGEKRRLDDYSTPVPQTSLMLKSQVDAYNMQNGISLDQANSEDFTIADIPLFSGLDGPTASIIDTLLEILIKFGGSALKLPKDTASDIIGVIKTLSSILLNTDNSNDAKENLKSILSSIVNIAPIPERLKGFVPVIIDSFYLLRGGTQDVVDFGTSAVKTVFDMAAGAFNSSTTNSILGVLETALLNGVELGGRLATAKQEASSNGQSFELTAEIQGFMLEKLVDFTTSEFLSEFVSKAFPGSNFAEESSALMKILIPLIKAFISRDFEPLFDVIPDTISFMYDKYREVNGQTKVGLSTETKSGLNTLSRVFHLAIVLYNEFSDVEGDIKKFLVKSADPASVYIQELLSKLVKSALPMLGKTGLSEEKVTSAVSKVFQAYQKASADDITTKADLKTRVKSVLTDMELSDSNADLISEVLSLLGSIIVPGIKKPGLSDISQLMNLLLDTAISSSMSSLVGLDQIADTIAHVKKQALSASQTIFGLIAMLKKGGAAQKIFIDADKDEVDGKISTTVKKRIVDTVRNQSINLVSGILKKFVSEENADTLGTFIDMFINLIMGVVTGDGQAIKNIFQSILLQAVNIFISKTLGIDGSVASEIILNLFSGIFSGKTIGETAKKVATKEQIKTLAQQALTKKNAGSTVKTLANSGIDLFFGLKDMFTNTLDFIFQQLVAALTQFLTKQVTKLTNLISSKINNVPLLKLQGTLGFKGSSMLGVQMKYNLNLAPNLEWDSKAFVEWMLDIIFKGFKDFDLDIGGFFKKILSFLSITPIFSASLTVKAMSSGKGGLFSAALGALGADLTVSGGAHFKLQLFSFKAGGFDTDGFIKLLEWGLSLQITISRDFTLFDVVTAGAGGGPLNKAAKYIGLDTIKITIYLGFAFEIIMIAAHNGEPAQGKLTISLKIGAAVTIGFDLAIVGLKIKAGIEIKFTFIQDLSGLVTPAFKMTLDILFFAEVKLKFLFWSWKGRFEFRPPGSPYDITPKSKGELKENAFGYDTDGDGISDAMEELDPSISYLKADTDGDGLSDKFELKVSKTDPSIKDTDGDGLTDYMEWKIFKTNAHLPDTDYDGLTDSEEAILYGTNPLSRDTDEDQLTDYFEVYTAWNITGVTTSVKSVQIGDKEYVDHTDPNNADTDGDGLKDGEEGEFGNYFGPDLYSSSDYTGDPPLYFNGGYTHPLDNDTDDDSYAQYYDGSISGEGLTRIFFRDMTDGVEINGITATVVEVDSEGLQELVTKTFFTNPTNPDSDGDTGVPLPREKVLGAFLNSDGYELTLDPATNPLKGDTDGDGLIDGLEGTLKFDRNATTNPFAPDTDGDGLPDGLEFTLGSNPNNPDTDADLVLDGDEFYLFHTNPFLPDTDFDGVFDGFELFFSHSSPQSGDSDGDGLTDYDEIFLYGTDPVDEDSDNDNLTDRDEILDYGTDATNPDSDEDGLRDGPEILEYRTDPNNPDSDSDSIMWLNEYGEPTFLWTDGMEVEYGTNPNSHDTDLDGIIDSWELYLANGNIPGFKNLPLDVLNNDTDGDGYSDGSEMTVNMTQNLIYPYVAFQVFFPFHSSPVSEDTDGDNLTDAYEISNGINANSTDSDGDGLSDFDELFIHLTSPTNDDSDGDGILDSQEVTSASNSTSGLSLSSAYSPLYATSAFDPDSDGDGWPDGLEINGTDGNGLYNPYEKDVNKNGIKDGYERDYDSDGISDGDEYYTYNTYGDVHGGFLDYRNPDSDFDGLLDSEEILEYKTMPFNPDTDFDGYSDSLELFVGTDPLEFTTRDAFLAAMQILYSPVKITSPENGKTYTENNIEIKIESSIDLLSAKARYREYNANNLSLFEDEWSEYIDLKKNLEVRFGVEVWSTDKIEFKNGTTYIVEVIAVAETYTYPTSDQELEGAEFRLISIFSLDEVLWLGLAPKYWFAGGGTLLGMGMMIAILRKSGIPLKEIPKKLRRKKKE